MIAGTLLFLLSSLLLAVTFSSPSRNASSVVVLQLHSDPNVENVACVRVPFVVDVQARVKGDLWSRHERPSEQIRAVSRTMAPWWRRYAWL